MQLGMIGLGRMGANMVRRLLKGGHECVVFDMSREGGGGAGQGKGRRHRVAGGVRRRSSRSPARVWLMVPAGVVDKTIADLLPHLERGDILIDGGNSYYIDDIRRAKELTPKGIHYVDVGTSGGVWGLERGYCMMIGGEADVVKHLDPIFATLAPGRGDIPRTPGREKAGGTAEQGYLHCGPNGAGHFVKMVHNGIEYGVMAAYAEGLAVLKAANVGKQSRRRRCRNDAAARSRALSIRSQSAGYRRGLAPRQRDRLLAARPFGSGVDRRIPRCRSSRAACRIPAKAAGRSRPRSTRACRPMCCHRPSTSGSARAARRISPTSCSRPCATQFGGHLEKPSKS